MVNSSTQKFLILLLFITIPIAGLTFVAPDAHAFMFYSDATNDQGGCAQCHTGFRDNNNYTSLAEGVSWGDSLHNVHLRNTTIDSSCDNCHGGAGTSGRTVNPGSSLAAADGVNFIGCTGCHGRLEDENAVAPVNGAGRGAGLRQHHFVNGTTICLGCHGDADPANFTVAGEDTLPPWYGSVINDIVGLNLEPCNAAGEEQLAGLMMGLDNDGDNAYDTADPDCACGNGIIDPGEACDDGAANGTTICGCQTDCTYTTSGTACGDPSVTECDNADTCDGMGTCDPNVEPDGTACGDPSNTDCTNPDTCLSGACEPNDEPAGTLCEDGLFCTVGDTCDGAGVCDGGPDSPCLPTELCQEPDQCIPQVDCGNGIIDPGEACDDGAANGTTECGCQLDCQYTAEFTACGDPLDTECDNPDSCDGMGACDLRYEPAGFACGDQGVECLVDDTCDGMGLCTDNGLEPDGTACGDPSNTECDNPDSCLIGACAPNNEPDGTACGDPSNTDCTNPDSCLTGACEPNNEPAGTTCDDLLFCTDPDACDGAGVCAGGPTPCVPGEICNEDTNTCEVSAAPPPVNQNIGRDDTVFNNLVQADCRSCHDNINTPVNVEGRCSETGTVCFVDADCTGGADVCVDVLLKDRHHILALTPEPIPNPGSLIFFGTCSVTTTTACNTNADCPGGETCNNVPLPNPPYSPTDADINGDGQRDTIYGCNNCHIDDPATPVIDFTVTRDCTLCHVQTGGVEGQGSVHHNTPTAEAGLCTPCHGSLVDDMGDGHVIPTYDASLVTPRRSDGLGPDNSYGNGRGACNFCHDQDTVPPATPLVIQTNQTNHHSTGFYNQGVCDWCHLNGNPTETAGPLDIRTCENCHGYESLHNIAVNSDATGLVDTDGDGVPDTPNIDGIFVGAENPYFGHVGNNDDCLGCHGGYMPANAPGTGPITPFISGYNVHVVTAGADKAVTLTGSAFTNYLDGTLWTSIVTMTGSDGSLTALPPDAIDEGSLTVTIPGTTAPGNYTLHAVKDTAKSNPAVISVIPNVAIDSVDCSKKKGMLTVTGTGFGDDKPEGTDGDLNLEVNGQAVELISWADTRIKASVDRCEKRTTVTVNALFGSATDGKPCKGKKCR